MRKRNPFGGHGDDEHGGLMITPLLDLFVALMPMLILSAVMTKINVVDVAVSKPVAVIKNQKNKDFDLTIKLSKENISLVLNGKVAEMVELGALEEDAWKDRVHTRLVEIKKKFPGEFELKLEPENNMELEYIMTVMDLSREMKATDEEIIRNDEATGKPVRVKYLFPKVILRGVYT